LRGSYEAQHDDYATAHVCDFVLRGRANPESVLAMIEKARLNARGCRSAITLEVWEAVNEGWMALRDLLARPVRVGSLDQALAAIRRESTLARGATHGSMLRNEIYCFTRVGTFIERADNTARILDVKYYLLLPSLAYVGTRYGDTTNNLNAEVWVKQQIADLSKVKGYLFYKGKQVSETSGSYPLRATPPELKQWEYHMVQLVFPALVEKPVADGYTGWKLWENPGEYEVKLLRDNKIARTFKFTIGANGKPVDGNGVPMGAMEQVTAGPGHDVDLDIARDGRIVFAILKQNADIWRLPVDPQTGAATGPAEEVIAKSAGTTQRV
jgi:hypothetical protein